MRRPGGRRAVLVAAVTVVAAVAGLVAGAPAGAAAPPPRSVFVLGDSVMAGAADVVRAALPEWRATIGTFVGLPTREGVQALRERRAELGPVVVIELGANDWGVPTASFSRSIDDAMAVLAGRHVIWLTVPRFRPEVDAVNGAIRAAAERHPAMEVLDWGALVAAHPEVVRADGYHLRPSGQRLLADAVRGALERWWAAASAPCEPPPDDAVAANAVARLYRAYLLRDPDAAGLAYWVARYRAGALCLPEVSELFAESPEFVAAYGPLGVPDFVRRVYLHVLGREPDPEGYTYWALRLTSGGLRRGALMVAFSESPEFRSRSGLP